MLLRARARAVRARRDDTAVWAAFVNTVGADGLSDIVLTAIVLGSFAAGFVVGALDFGRWTGIILIGILGGFSVGVRVVLLRPGLLVPEYVANWGVLAVFMVLGLASILVRQRFGLVSIFVLYLSVPPSRCVLREHETGRDPRNAY